MLDNRLFWLAQNLVLSMLWLAAIALFTAGHPESWIVRLAEFGVVVHLFEIPFVFRQLAARGVSPTRIFLLTLLFGFTWWIPVLREVYATA